MVDVLMVPHQRVRNVSNTVGGGDSCFIESWIRFGHPLMISPQRRGFKPRAHIGSETDADVDSLSPLLCMYGFTHA